ncbi:hypothetical protein [Helicobacter sp. T3_23-1056]
MTLEQLESMIANYDSGTMDRTWDSRQDFSYANEYIIVVAIDSSNKWIEENQMAKMWSIIFQMKQDICLLPKYKELQKILNTKITPVTSGKNKGCYGIRIYNMKQEPKADIVKVILDFIFS